MRRKRNDTATLFTDPWAGVECPLVVSVQGGEGSPLESPETLAQCAEASMLQGIQMLRMEGVQNVCLTKAEMNPRMIGLIKRLYPGSEVYITPTDTEVRELVEHSNADVIAMDATGRRRPNGETFEQLAALVHSSGRWVMADCDTVEGAIHAAKQGADILSSTLSGYTANAPASPGPDLEFIRTLRAKLDSIELPHLMVKQNGTRRPLIFGEGRYSEPWQVRAALHAGADAVVIGGAINDPVKNTRRFMPAPLLRGKICVVDVGGTWLRIGQLDTSGCAQWGKIPPVQQVEKIPLPPTRAERLNFIASHLKREHFVRLGISSAGVIWQNRITLSKKFIPENQDTDYNVLRQYLKGDDPMGVIALGDGHASAWAHACHPDFAGKDLVVLAIGTGLGFGHVRQGKIVMGPEGEYSRLNDLPGPGGKTFEQIMGGMFLTAEPTEEQKALANEAVEQSIRMISTFLFPDVVILCGTVGMQPWLNVHLAAKDGWPLPRIVRSPLGSDAGLYGAAAIAMYPPDLG